ncbi:hypothetical protein QBZ16_001270 [Prototheca wickerhamii]|uniref:Ubiquitin thioesterase OTU n=1 Tax=Prototheca wickerhamii TaxID=3111 RepID=A0AAD9IDC7_PROWI|nr:hypothetical protein QBZ16_001270 [Prototheca wickerhamii]
MARHQGIHLSANIETQEADQLRGAVAEALCRTPARRREFRDALLSVQAEGYTLPGYCRQLMSPGFWGGEPELLVLSSMLKVPIVVYTPTEHGASKYAILYKAGEQYERPGKGWKARKPVCLLYSNGNHYDLLVT